jgi:hypothetical protein
MFPEVDSNWKVYPVKSGLMMSLFILLKLCIYFHMLSFITSIHWDKTLWLARQANFYNGNLSFLYVEKQ